MSKEASETRITELMDAGWRLFGTPHMRGPKGHIIQVHRTTFKKMIKDGLIVVKEKTHEYVRSNPK